jgi:Ca2+-binding EF-hand superfamily protein
VRFSTEAEARKAERSLADKHYKVWLLDEEEYEEIEYDEGRGHSRPRSASGSGSGRLGRSWSDTSSTDRATRKEQETMAKRLATVIGQELREVLPRGADLRNTFRWMDTNGDGVLSHDELSTGLRELTGRGLTDDHLREIIKVFDKNGDGEIQYREFCDIFEAFDRAESTTKDVLFNLRSQLRTYSNQSDDELRRVFRGFDVNRDGKLSRTEFQSGLRSLKIELDSEQMDDIMRVIDADGDGEIDLDEFLSVATPIPRKATMIDSTASLTGQLEVRVVKCTNLLPRDWNKRSSDPCVKMSIGQGSNKQEWKSKVQQQSLDPVFSDGRAVFNVHDDGASLYSNALSTLVIQVCHWSMLGDKLLGEVDIDLRREFGDAWATGQQKKRHTWQLTDYDNKIPLDSKRTRLNAEPYGLIELEIKFIPKASTVPGSAARITDGQITAKIVGCNDLIPMDRNGLSDPYVKVELLQGPKYEDIQDFKTSTIKRTLNPVFTDRPQLLRVDYDSYKAGRCWLRVTVYDWDRAGKDDFQGLIQVDLNNHFGAKWSTSTLQMRQTFQLTDPEKKITVPPKKKHLANPYGTVQVHLDFVGSSLTSTSVVGSANPFNRTTGAAADASPRDAVERTMRKAAADSAIPTEPVCLLQRDGRSLRIHRDGKRLLEALGEAPVAVLAIAGLGRTGKSFLLNQLLGRGHRDTDGFAMDMDDGDLRRGSDGNGTSGVWCCVVPSENWHYEEAPNTRLLLLDTERLGSADSGTSQGGIGWDLQCFSLSVLLSSLFVYNSIGEIDDRAFEQLYMVKELTQHIRVSASPDSPRSARPSASEDTLARYTPDFMWLLRDFEPPHSDGDARTEAQRYLEDGLVERRQKATARSSSPSSTRLKQQNQTRAAFRQLFPAHHCRSLICPVRVDDDLRVLGTLPSRSFQDDFQRQMRELRADIFRMVKPKRLFGQTVSARLLLNLAHSYVDDLNRRVPADIRKAWDSSEGRVLSDVYDSARELYEKGMEERCSVREDIYLYECIHPAGVTETLELGAHPQLIAQIEEGETIEVFEQDSFDRGSQLGVVERLRTHCGWVSKEAGSKRLFIEIAHLETREKILVKQVRDCLRRVDQILKGEITGVNRRNANRKRAQELCQAIWAQLDDKLPEAQTLEWSKARVDETRKLLRHYTKLRSYDVREADLGILLNLMQELYDLRWHAPIDDLAGAAVGVLGGAQPQAADEQDYFTTTIIRPPKGGFGMNIGHNCEILDFNRSLDGKKSVAEVAGVTPGMTIVEVNGIPVYDKKGVLAAITRGSSAKTLFKLRRAASSARHAASTSTGAASSALSTAGSSSTHRFDEPSAIRRAQLGDAHGRQQRRVLLSREQLEEAHWELAGEAVATFEGSAAVPTVETVLQKRQKLDREMKEIYTRTLQELQQDSMAQCRSLMHELCEGLLKRVHYGYFDYPRGEPDYQRALVEMMDVYDKEAGRRGGPAKDKIAAEAITAELPRVYKAFMDRQLATEETKNRGLETVLGACRCIAISSSLPPPPSRLRPLGRPPHRLELFHLRSTVYCAACLVVTDDVHACHRCRRTYVRERDGPPRRSRNVRTPQSSGTGSAVRSWRWVGVAEEPATHR